MSEIRDSRWQLFLRRVFGITDRFAPTVLEDLMPVYSVEDHSEPHLQFEKGASVVSGGVAVTSAVADTPVVDLGPNAINSRALLDVVFLAISSPGVAQIATVQHIALGVGGAITGTQLAPMDGRLQGPGDNAPTQPQRSGFSFGAQIAGIGALQNVNAFQFILPQNSPVLVPWKSSLYRSFLRFQSSVVNTTLRVGVIGLERFITEPAQERRQSGPGGAGP